MNSAFSIKRSVQLLTTVQADSDNNHTTVLTTSWERLRRQVGVFHFAIDSAAAGGGNPLRMSSCQPAELTTMARADAAAVAGLRDLAGRFLDENLDIDAERRADLVLALDEALSNCAEHAYRDSGSTEGMMTLELTYDIAGGTVRMCVTDSGAWVPPTASAPTSTRGRGLLLMRALADDLTVDGTAEGTTVCLHFERCPARATMLDLDHVAETGRMSTNLDQ